MAWKDIPFVGSMLEPLDTLGEAIDNPDSAAEQLKKRSKTGISKIDDVIQPAISGSGFTDWINNAWIWVKEKFNWLQDLVLGWAGGENAKPAKIDSLKRIDDQKSEFTSLAQSLLPAGKTAEAAALAADIQKECEKTIKDAFGWFGMSKDPKDTITQSIQLYNVLQDKIKTSLLQNHGLAITDEQASSIASKSAASISGLDLSILSQDRPELRFEANPPTKGIAAMMLAVQKGVNVKNGSKVNVPALTFDEAVMTEAKNEAKSLGDSPAAAPTPASVILDKALSDKLAELNDQKWGRALGNKDGVLTLDELKAALPKGFTFASLDANKSGVIAGSEIVSALNTVRQGKAVATGI